MSAVDAAGNESAFSEPLTATTAPDVTPPTAPSGLRFRDGVLFGLATGVGSAWVYAPDGTSTWTVVAVDRSGNSSAPSNPATVAVVADPDFC